MTIALGMLAGDGIIVLAADTQLGETEYLKTGEGKIAMSTSRVVSDHTKTRSFAITGAENVPYLDAQTSLACASASAGA